MRAVGQGHGLVALNAVGAARGTGGAGALRNKDDLDSLHVIAIAAGASALAVLGPAKPAHFGRMDAIVDVILCGGIPR